jgi:excisionase family DNA binding protein
MEDYLSTEQVGWLLGRSSGSVRRMIRDGEIDAVRLPQGFRVAREEALRLSRQRIEGESGRELSDRELERLVEEVLEANERITES